MRSLVLLMAVACSSKTDKPAEQAPVVKLPSGPVRAVCPQGILTTHPWTHEVFPACPPPQHWTDGIRCEGACPKPCRRTSQLLDMEPHTNTVLYDAAGRWIGDQEKAEPSRSCEYDAAGHMTRCTDYDGVSVIERDDRGRISSVTNPEGTLNRFTYDERGRVSEIYEMLLQTSKLEYDEAGWLVREHHTGLFVDRDQLVTYHYDDRGRVTHFDAKNIMHAGASQIRPEPTASRYTYDAQGRLAETTSDGVRERYTYDAKGRVIRYVRDDTDKGTVSETEALEYCD